jgi:hypothetical protein
MQPVEAGDAGAALGGRPGASRMAKAPWPVHPATHRASDGAPASSQLRVPGREYPFRDAEPADHAP